MAGADNLVGDIGRIVDLQRSIVSGELAPIDLLERCLARIEAVDGRIQAWQHIDEQGARVLADRLTKEAKNGLFRGPLHGIPFAVKDNIDVEGISTKCNSISRADIEVASVDAEVVLALRAAGAIPLGKTHTTEFAYFDPSPAANPHNILHTPGGSSSGSAAAVAAGMVPFAIGTQTIASVNRPAAYCGIGAFKPSTGSLSSFGVVPLAPVFDTIGFHGVCVEDAITAFESVMPHFVSDVADNQADETVQVIVLEDVIFEEAAPEIRESISNLQQAFADAGMSVIKRESPVPLRRLADLQKVMMFYEVGRVLRYLEAEPDGSVGERILAAVSSGQKIGIEEFCSAQREATEMRRDLLEVIQEDVVMFPATPTLAPAGLDSTGDPHFIAPWTVVGGPIVSVPAGFGNSGLPIGCAITSKPGSDAKMCRRARKIAPVVRECLK